MARPAAHPRLGIAVLAVAVAGLFGASAADAATGVTGGTFHTCALTGAGGVQCWGLNAQGRLGDGTTTDRDTPVPVVGLGSGVSQVSAGAGHTCALTDAGAVECWGDNSYGQLGDGTTESRATPTAVVGLQSGVAAIDAGRNHTCALTVTGAVECWGDNFRGQLGDGTTNSHDTPTPVAGLPAGIVGIAAGGSHTCAVTGDGAVECWGSNSSGQLGDGTTNSHDAPIPVEGLGGAIDEVDAGAQHTCALTESGEVECWGDDSEGQLGSRATKSPEIPGRVLGLGGAATAIATGEIHSCALIAGGEVDCWGSDERGQLGDGSTAPSREAPSPVQGLAQGASAIAAGGFHACAIVVGGKVACWGDNFGGQLGDGATNTRRSTAGPVDPFGQAISFLDPGDRALAEADVDLGASASSGLAVSYASETEAVCAIVGGRVHLSARGECTVAAEQGGDAEYAAASPVERSFRVAGATPTLTTAVSPPIVLGGQISGTARLAGGIEPSGSITFRAYGPDDEGCVGSPVYVSGAVPVSGDGEYSSGPFAPAVPGAYRFTATYSGDARDEPVGGACEGPAVAVSAPAAAAPAPTPASPPATAPHPTPAPTVRVSYHADRRHRADRAGGPRYIFRLSASTPGATFLCSLDGSAFEPCASPKAYRHLKPGRHVFRARSVDASGAESAIEKVVFRAERKSGHAHGR